MTDPVHIDDVRRYTLAPSQENPYIEIVPVDGREGDLHEDVSSLTTLMECSRCHTQVVATSETLLDDWSSFCQGAFLIPPRVNLCPACTKAFHEDFLKSGSDS